MDAPHSVGSRVPLPAEVAMLAQKRLLAPHALGPVNLCNGAELHEVALPLRQCRADGASPFALMTSALAHSSPRRPSCERIPWRMGDSKANLEGAPFSSPARIISATVGPSSGSAGHSARAAPSLAPMWASAMRNAPARQAQSMCLSDSSSACGSSRFFLRLGERLYHRAERASPPASVERLEASHQVLRDHRAELVGCLLGDGRRNWLQHPLRKMAFSLTDKRLLYRRADRNGKTQETEHTPLRAPERASSRHRGLRTTRCGSVRLRSQKFLGTPVRRESL